jgi:NTE family protein
VLDCNFPGNIPEVSGSMAEVLFYTVMVTMRAQAILEAPLVASDMPVVYLHGPEPFRISPLDFRHTGTLIETAYEAARSFLDELEITGPGLYGSP